MSTDRDRQELRRAMGEASVLPADDPLRHEVERRVTESGAWAETEWLELIAEYDRLRLELPRVESPAGMTERLLGIPDQAVDRARPVRRFPAARHWLVAAGVTVVFLVGGGIWKLDRQAALAGNIEAVALLALDDHVNDRSLALATDDPHGFCRSMGCGRCSGMNSMDECGCKLVGGRTCRWGDCPIVYTLWEREGDSFSLARFAATELKLPTEMDRRVVCCPQAGAGGEATDVVVWTEDGTGYALAGPHGAVGDLTRMN